MEGQSANVRRAGVNIVSPSAFSSFTTNPSTDTLLCRSDPELTATNRVVSSTCDSSSPSTVVLCSSVSNTTVETSSSLVPNINVVPISSSVSTISFISSPATERVEKLLDQYKACKAASPCSQIGAGAQESTILQNKQVLCELELWMIVNQKLQSEGFQPVSFVQDTSATITASADHHLALSITSSMIARHTVSSLLRKLEQKNEEICKLERKLSQKARKASTPIASLLLEQCQNLGEEKSKELTRLEYEKAKLKLDLQNKPDLDDLKVWQARVEELEMRLLQTESDALSEGHKLNKCQVLIKRIMSLLSVSQEELVLAGLRNLLSTLDNHSKLEKHFVSLLQLLHHHSVPKLAHQMWEEPVLPRTSGHDLWCEVTWQHVLTTLRTWAYHMCGIQFLEALLLKKAAQTLMLTGKHSESLLFEAVLHDGFPSELECVVGEVCEHLELRLIPDCSSGYHANLLGGEGEKMLTITCQELAVLLRRWLLVKANSKAASHQLMCAMVRHFQHLFNIPQLKGVYPAMCLLNQQNEQYRNVITRLKDSLDLKPNCSCHQLVTMIECIAHKDNAQFLSKIQKLFGPIEVDKLIEKLKLCDEFFPTFQGIIIEIQQILGVNTLSGIVPALYKLKKP